jgi:hypothetical protein
MRTSGRPALRLDEGPEMRGPGIAVDVRPLRLMRPRAVREAPFAPLSEAICARVRGIVREHDSRRLAGLDP